MQRQDILTVFDELLDAYHVLLESTDWLGEETRAKAIEKLDSMRVNAVYPDELGDWSVLISQGPRKTAAFLKRTLRSALM